MSSYTLPQTQRNRDLAEKVDAILVEAEKLGVPQNLRTRRQGRKFFQDRGGLRREVLHLRTLQALQS